MNIEDLLTTIYNQISTTYHNSIYPGMVDTPLLKSGKNWCQQKVDFFNDTAGHDIYLL